MMVKGNLSSLLLLNKQIKVCLGWDGSPLTDHDVLGKKLRDEDLHTLILSLFITIST